MVTLKNISISSPLEPVNVTLFGKVVFADVIRILRSAHSGLSKYVLISMTNVLIRKDRGRTRTEEEGHVRTEAEIGVRQPQAKEGLESLETGRGQEGLLEGAQSC